MPDYKIRLIVEGEDRGASRVLGGVSSSLGRIGEFAAGGLLARGIESAITGVTRMGQAGVSAMGNMIVGGADFEAQIDAINSLLGGTVDHSKELGDLIYGLGLDPHLQVTASEAADTIQMLARNGLGLDEIMSGAARAMRPAAGGAGRPARVRPGPRPQARRKPRPHGPAAWR